MIGIGAKLDKQTKIKLMAERARDYNQKYDTLIGQGFDPEQTASRLQQEEYQRRHEELKVEEPYRVANKLYRTPKRSTKSEEQSTSGTAGRTPSPPPPRTSMEPWRV